MFLVKLQPFDPLRRHHTMPLSTKYLVTLIGRPVTSYCLGPHPGFPAAKALVAFLVLVPHMQLNM